MNIFGCQYRADCISTVCHILSVALQKSMIHFPWISLNAEKFPPGIVRRDKECETLGKTFTRLQSIQADMSLIISEGFCFCIAAKDGIAV